MILRDDPSPASCDALFDLLATAHEGLDAVASARLNSMIILLLANHIGSFNVVRDAIDAARPLLDRKTQSDHILTP